MDLFVQNDVLTFVVDYGIVIWCNYILAVIYGIAV